MGPSAIARADACGSSVSGRYHVDATPPQTATEGSLAIARFERHVFICCNQREAGHPRGCCAEKGSEAVRAEFKRLIAANGLKDRVRANLAGCLDHCEHGVTVVVYPEQVWYGFVSVTDVAEIVSQYLLNGRPVGRLALKPGCINSKSCLHRRENHD